MQNEHTKYADKIGLPPGSLFYVGDERTEKVSITEFDFSKGFFKEIKLADISGFETKQKKDTVSWINVEGIHDTSIIESAGHQFQLDDMVLEDIVNTSHRPKAEEHEDYLFVTLKTLNLSENKKDIIIEHVSLVLGRHWLITFQEGGADAFNSIKKRIRNAQGRLPQKEEDFLFYRLIDTIVDNYFLTMDAIGEAIEDLEDKLIASPDENLHDEIYQLKKKIALIKKAIVPLRDGVSTIIRSDYDYISKTTRQYFSDVYEHLVHVIEEIHTQHETLNDFLNMYMSGMSNKMNEVMKVLTIFASIFIPLTFIAGVYGMNFKNMPELEQEHGYYITWLVMIGLAVGLLLFFRKKKWL